MKLLIKSCIGCACKMLEFILVFPGHILILMHLLAQVLTITTYLYHVEHSRLFWNFYLLVIFCSGIASAVLAFLFEISSHYCVFFSPDDLKKLPVKIKISHIESNVLKALTIMSAFVATFMWGGTGQNFTGDPWWLYVGHVSFVSGTLWAMSRYLLKLGYEKMFKTLTNNAT